MRVLICGDRNWDDADLIGHWLDRLRPSVVIEGEARGADRLGREAAERRGITVLPFPANWTKYHKAAGPIRNQQMLDEGKPDQVIAFHDNIEESKGTADMVARARKAGLRVIVVSHEQCLVYCNRCPGPC